MRRDSVYLGAFGQGDSFLFLFFILGPDDFFSSRLLLRWEEMEMRRLYIVLFLWEGSCAVVGVLYWWWSEIED
jgi:hypothetical protein